MIGTEADEQVYVELEQQISQLKTAKDEQEATFFSEKRALEEGDEAVTKQMGEGRDIMSILSAYLLPWPSVQYDSVLTLFSESEHGGLCRG